MGRTLWDRAGRTALFATFPCFVVVLVSADVATATFPGRNGLIAFASDRDPLLEHPQIFSLNVRGGQPRNLTRSTADDRDATPSPDGRLIAFTRSRAVWLMNVNGSGQRELAHVGEYPVWSPNGRTIAFNGRGPGDCPPGSMRCGHTVAVWTVRADGSAPRILEAASRNPSWSPSGRRVVFEGAIDPYGQANGIRVMNADGTNGRWIASAGAHPTWSPNGRLIAYDAASAIRLVRPDGTGRRRLAVGSSPIWAPRGNRLAYLCGRRTGWLPTSALCLIGADGSGRRVIARGILFGRAADSESAQAAWSPGGLQLAYASPDGIFVVNADGRGRRRIASKRRAISISSLAWSAGGRLLFTESRDHNDLEIYASADDGSNTKQLTRNAVDDLQPSWSPDGTGLAFVRARGGSRDIWVMHSDGSEQRLITRNGFDPGWTSDGKHIVFTRFLQVFPTIEPYSTYAVTVSSGEEQLLVAGASHGAPSPDGTRLAFVGDALEQLFVASADGSDATVLTPASTTESLSWSPDGATLAFGGSGGLYTIRADGRGLNVVAPQDAHAPSFSPDGTTLVFSEFNRQIETSQLDGSGRTVIVSVRGRNTDPDWQPLPR